MREKSPIADKKERFIVCVIILLVVLKHYMCNYTSMSLLFCIAHTYLYSCNRAH